MVRLLVSRDMGGAVSAPLLRMRKRIERGWMGGAAKYGDNIHHFFSFFMLATCNIQINTVQEIPAFLCSESDSASV